MSTERTPKLTSNMYIEGTPARDYPYSNPAHVSLRSFAGGAMNLTPDEARALAAALVAEADHADGKVAAKEPLVPGMNHQVVIDLAMTLAPILASDATDPKLMTSYDQGYRTGKIRAATEIEKVLVKHGLLTATPARS